MKKDYDTLLRNRDSRDDCYLNIIDLPPNGAQDENRPFQGSYNTLMKLKRK